MPQVEAKQSCKICGSPSITVVCMHCFLNYNYKVYVSDDQQQPVTDTSLQPMNTIQHQDDDYWKSESKRLEDDEDEVDSHPQFSLGSIFARLPRFE